MGYEKILWHIIDREEKSEWEALFIHSILQWLSKKENKVYNTVLDVPCGNGRLHPYLKMYGYEVKGFDINEELLQEAKERGCNCWKGDMRDINAYKGKYDVIINWFTSFGYFSHPENMKVLENFYHSLNDKGVLLIDLPASYPDYLYTAIRRGDKLIEIVESEVDGSINRITHRLYREEEDVLKLIKELKVDLRIYSPDEMLLLLESVGFHNVYTFETFKLLPDTVPDKKQITFVALKKTTGSGGNPAGPTLG